MSIHIEEKDGFLEVNLQGDIDHHNTSKFRVRLDNEIQRKKPSMVIMNFSQVRFMDSSGIGFIIGRYKLLKSIEGRLFVVNLSKGIYRIFEISGLFRLIKHYDTLEQCIKKER